MSGSVEVFLCVYTTAGCAVKAAQAARNESEAGCEADQDLRFSSLLVSIRFRVQLIDFKLTFLALARPTGLM